MSGIVGIGLQLTMGASLMIGASMDVSDSLQDNINWSGQDAYFQDVLPKVLNYDPTGSFGFGFEDNVSFRYHSVDLKNLRFVNQKLSQLQYEVLEVHDNAGNDVAVLKTLETMNGASNEIQVKVREDVKYENLKSARFRLVIKLPVELKRVTVPLKEGSHALGDVTVQVSAIMKESRTSESTLNGWTTVEEHPVTTVSYSQDKSSSGDVKQVHLLGLSGIGYSPIVESWKSFRSGTMNYHITFDGEPSQLELIDSVNMKRFSYNMLMEFKTGQIMIDP